MCTLAYRYNSTSYDDSDGHARASHTCSNVCKLQDQKSIAHTLNNGVHTPGRCKPKSIFGVDRKNLCAGMLKVWLDREISPLVWTDLQWHLRRDETVSTVVARRRWQTDVHAMTKKRSRGAQKAPYSSPRWVCQHVNRSFAKHAISVSNYRFTFTSARIMERTSTCLHGSRGWVTSLHGLENLVIIPEKMDPPLTTGTIT